MICGATTRSTLFRRFSFSSGCGAMRHNVKGITLEAIVGEVLGRIRLETGYASVRDIFLVLTVEELFQEAPSE